MDEENEKDRLDREVSELLQELRVILPGVQVLFAFLLTLPFSQRFEDVTQLQKAVYYATLLCTALATAMLIAPSAQHRLSWRRHTRKHRLEIANRLAILGSVLLTLATCGAIFVISDVLFGIPASIGFTVSTGGIFVWLWYGIPILRRLRDR